MVCNSLYGRVAGPHFRCGSTKSLSHVTVLRLASRLSGFSSDRFRHITVAASTDKKDGVSTSSGQKEQEKELVRLTDQPEKESKYTELAIYVAASVAFGVGIWANMGGIPAQEYFAGYLLEQSLSIDNLFVFVLVFGFFKCPPEIQPKILSWGIGSAAALRAIMIFLGANLIENFKPILGVFAAILLYSSYNLLASGDEDEDEEDLSDNSIVKFCKKFVTCSESYDGDSFFTTTADGAKIATPMLLVLAVVELSDVVFAVDSIPAVFGVTTDPFIVYTSNMFAILSLRSLYFFVATVMQELKYLDKAVAVVLGFIGAKMILDLGGFEISTSVSLEVVAGVLGVGVAASLLDKSDEEESAV